ncbi:MAG: NFACT family protein [Chloroflexi bacterium]|nr:NFACT family protein [Chloroflexota bacterium]
MSIDVFTLSALVDEFMDHLVGGRVQDSVSIDSTSLGLEIYANHRRQYLLLSADSLQPRVHLVSDKLRRGMERPSQLGLLIRSHVEGGSIVHVSQPPWERVLHIEIDGPEGLVTLIVEPMERRSNLLLVKDGIILDCIRRVGPDENRYRVSLPAHAYAPPPPQTGKLDPFGLTLESLAGIIAQNEDPKRKAHQVMTSRLLGISPLLAREMVSRAGSPPEALPSQVTVSALYEAFTASLKPMKQRDWSPGIVERDGMVTAFSPYVITGQPGWRSMPSMSEAMAAFYGAPVGDEAYEAAKQPVREAIAATRTRLETKLASLKRSMTDDSERERMRQSGELILAYQYAVQPGQTELRAPYEVDAPDLVILSTPSSHRWKTPSAISTATTAPSGRWTMCRS